MVTMWLIDMVCSFSKVSSRDVAYNIVDVRPGDVVMCYANPRKANDELGRKAKFVLIKCMKMLGDCKVIIQMDIDN